MYFFFLIRYWFQYISVHTCNELIYGGRNPVLLPKPNRYSFNFIFFLFFSFPSLLTSSSFFKNKLATPEFGSFALPGISSGSRKDRRQKQTWASQRCCATAPHMLCVSSQLSGFHHSDPCHPWHSVFQGKMAQFHCFSAKPPLLARGFRAILN